VQVYSSFLVYVSALSNTHVRLQGLTVLRSTNSPTRVIGAVLLGWEGTTPHGVANTSATLLGVRVSGTILQGGVGLIGVVGVALTGAASVNHTTLVAGCSLVDNRITSTNGASGCHCVAGDAPDSRCPSDCDVCLQARRCPCSSRLSRCAATR
jgi:hypothetical protein